MCFGTCIAEDGLPLRSIPLQAVQRKPNIRLLRVSLGAQPRCVFGDLDLISLDLGQSDGELVLQLTLETLGTGADVISFGVPKEGSGKNPILRTYEVELPRFDKPTVMGLYLCSVDTSQDREGCGSFQVRSFDEMFERHRVRPVVKDGRHVKSPVHPGTYVKESGSVYFYRTVLVDGDKLEFVGKSMTAKRYDQLFSTFVSRSANVVDLDTVRALVRKNGSILQSYPLASNAGALQLILPYYKEDKCVKKK